MTQEIEVTLPLDDDKTRVLVLKTASGDAKIRFRELEYNEMQNLQVLLSKRKDGDIEAAKELDALIFNAIESVEGLVAYGKEITLEHIKAGTFPAKVKPAIEVGFYLTFAAEKSEAEPKNDEKEGASSSD